MVMRMLAIAFCYIAKVSEKMGVDFSFTDNKRLKESGFAIDGVTVNGFVNEDGITVNVSSAKALNSVVGHEITHVLEGTDLYDSLKEAVETWGNTKGIYETRLKELTELYQGKEGYTGEEAAAKIEREVVADLIGDYLFTDKAFVENLAKENPGLFQRIFEEIKYLCKLVTAGSKEARQMEKVKKIFQDVYREASENGVKNPTAEGGVKYSLLVKDKNGNTTAVNPYVTTKEQSKEYMVKSRKGELDQYSYFPVSAHTPATVIATLKNAGIEITDKPLAMQAKKARQSQIDGQHIERDGTEIRHHALSPSEIQEAIDKLEDPIAAIHQEDRVKKKVEEGKTIYVPAPDNFVFFVTLDSGKEVAAVIEFDSFINEDMIQEDGQGDEYHTTVTVFEPDQYRNGEEFDYIEYIVTQQSNTELEIKKESSKTETAISQTQATVSEKELSSNSIREPEGKVNKNSLSAQGQVETDGQGWQVQGRDVALEQEQEGLGLPMPPGYQKGNPVAGATQKGSKASQTAREVGLPVPGEPARVQSDRADGNLTSPEDAVRSEQQSLDDAYRRHFSTKVTEGIQSDALRVVC